MVKVYLVYSFLPSSLTMGANMDAISQLPTEDVVRDALRSVDDPEVGMNIVDLGLVYRIDIAHSGIRIEMTMTTPACPMGGLITDDAKRAVAATAPAGVGVDIDLVWEPPWTPELMSETAKRAFGWTTDRSRKRAGDPEGPDRQVAAGPGSSKSR